MHVVFKTRVQPNVSWADAHVGAEFISARALGPHEVYAWYTCEHNAEPCQVRLGYVATGEFFTPEGEDSQFIDTVTWDGIVSGSMPTEVFHVFRF